MLRSLRPALLITAGLAATVALLLGGPGPSIGGPGLHSVTAVAAFETFASVVAAVAAFLVFGRLLHYKRRRDLWLVVGLSLFALTNLAFGVVASSFPDAYPDSLAIWATTVGTAIGAAFLALGSLATPTPLSRPVRVLALTLVPAFAAIVLAALLLDALLTGVSGLNAALVAKGTLLALAAVGFARTAEREQDELPAWFACGAVLGAVAAVAYVFYPTRHTEWIFVGDLLRLGFYLLVLAGVGRELRRSQAHAVEAGRLEERRRLAYDIHDALAQDLAFIAANAGELGRRPNPERAGHVVGAAQRALSEAREAIAVLAGTDPGPLETRIANSVEHVAAREGVGVALELEPGLDVDESVVDALVRVAQEAVANAARHARASAIRVQLQGGPDLRLLVSDDGVGFRRGREDRRGHLGLVSMERRVEAVGGRCRISSTPGRGTVVEVAVPSTR